MNSLFYRLFGYWIRRDACRLAAVAMKTAEAAEGYTPKLWSVTVFFEMYLREGSEGTMEDFGPKDPIELAMVSKETAA